MKLIATKSLTYATRRLKPGDPFEATDRHGRLLIGIKKARDPDQRDAAKIPAPDPAILQKLANLSGGQASSAGPTGNEAPGSSQGGHVGADQARVPGTSGGGSADGGSTAGAGVQEEQEIAALRAKAAAANIRIDMRWGAKRIQAELDKATGA